MFGIKYFKADSSTYVIKSANGKTRKNGKGLSFFFNSAITSIAAIPVSAKEAPFIFNLQTADFQSVRVQGQITYRVTVPETTAEILNFNLKQDGTSYISEDPMKLDDRVIRSVQTIIQNEIQNSSLRKSLLLNQSLVQLLRRELVDNTTMESLGISVIETSLTAITPTPETSRALEADARESILKEADDAIYDRRKSSVEQERVIKEAELQTELSIQQKEQEIEESRIQNEREILRGMAKTDQEKLQTQVDQEVKRKELVAMSVENQKMETDSEAYNISQRMNAFKELPVENLKAMALANMQPDQLMAIAFESLAQNAGKIGELNITPDLFGQAMKKAVRK
jgi:hypothetical protein